MSDEATQVFSVWAPHADQVRLRLDDPEGPAHDLQQASGGWWISDIPMLKHQRYAYEVHNDDGWSKPLPDPRTRSQPDGIHGFSEVVVTDFAWSDEQWTGRGLSSMILYELHVGTFTPAGTLDAAVEKLDYLVELGVNTVELMPVQPFGGERNWGYDGVDWYAVHEAYGGVDGLKRFVNAAHARGLAVVLDVVYNHFGPDGNYVGMFGPYTAAGATGWGDVVNLSGPDSDEVRAYVLGAVRQWLGEFHIDGLRLDAVHAYDDRLAYSIMEDMSIVAAELEGINGRPRTLIAESDLNNPRLITERAAGGYGLDGQWVDDIHHGIHTLITGEDHAYYKDYGDIEVLADTLRMGWRYNQTYSAYRRRTHGRALDLAHTPAWRLVTYTTTHDQVGNRAAGDRPSMNLSPTQQVLKAALIYLSPFTPMLFMGEEFGARTPFPFFISHTDEHLLDATREGRRAEFASAGWADEEIADPADPETFHAAKLDWTFTAQQQEIFDAYRRLLALRTDLRIAHPDLRDWFVETGGNEKRWLAFGHGEYLLVANLSDQPVTAPFGGELVYSFTRPSISNEDTKLGAWEFALLRRGA
ncbi:malto-oligosyltrehalose trehalohydrolase [Corynebacterium yudongzhengii]|uniref:Malto-oligosyltrehalose trehalohydrolase n=1 Tax=Corynebacterium yudongzhengii TaxID=2080740 RepID=A0A2U1T6L3_9CORY|nr:malto-oligosyltrehalose trehalohydrolase [Corynebacterium yudongzhengii]AWB82934.1 malto-oligosyltrehalose trehalohydrolase [Corynebacterium yudongzhengii]PWC01629.1 malto-oligosyltrehalose trehalohydrolase [Corynebacterium yudongzhengii]